MAKILLDAGASARARAELDVTPLEMAAEFGHAEVAEVLLAHGADVNAKNEYEYGLTPLMAAVVKNVETVKVLLDAKADVNVKGGDCPKTALQIAVQPLRPQHEIVKLLLARGADPNAKDCFDNTAMYFAWQKKTKELLAQYGGVESSS